MPDASSPDDASDGAIDGVDAGVFRARLIGDLVVVDVPDGLPPLTQLSCSGWWAVLEKPDGARWVPLQDDRHPSSNNPGYFLDGEYIEPSFNLGCDVIGCDDQPFSDLIYADDAREYVKVGTMALPEDVSPAPGMSPPDDPADVIETRPFSGALRVRFTYSTERDCSEPHEVTVPLEIPEHGVCCPIGSPSCSSTGPGGGWAPTADACLEWSEVFDESFVITTDPRGCPALADDPDTCCGCSE